MRGLLELLEVLEELPKLKLKGESFPVDCWPKFPNNDSIFEVFSLLLAESVGDLAKKESVGNALVELFSDFSLTSVTFSAIF